MALPITADTRVTVTVGPAYAVGNEQIATTLGRFLTENEDDSDFDQIGVVAALARGEVYRGGGGAAGEWTVELAWVHQPRAERATEGVVDLRRHSRTWR